CLRARGSLRPLGRLGARPHGGVARPLHPGLRSGEARGALRGLPLPVQSPARSRRLLPGHPARPDPAWLPRCLLQRRLLPRGPARGPGPRALRRRVPHPGPRDGLPAQPPLLRVSALVPAAVHRRTVQAPASLPAMDGAPRAAGLRPLEGHSSGRAADPGGHAHREHGAIARAHAPAQPELEDGRGDHRRPPPARPDRSGEVRLLPLPYSDVGAVPRPARGGSVRAVSAPAGVPPLARPSRSARVSAAWPWVVVVILAVLVGLT